MFANCSSNCRLLLFAVILILMQMGDRNFAYPSSALYKRNILVSHGELDSFVSDISTDSGTSNRSSTFIDAAEWNFLIQLLQVLENLSKVHDHQRYYDRIDNRKGSSHGIDNDDKSEDQMVADQPDDRMSLFNASEASAYAKSGPTLESQETVNKTFNPYQAIRERDKELRLKAIREQVLEMITHTAGQEDILKVLYTNVHEVPPFLPDGYTQKVKQHHPSCATPRHTKKEEWLSEEEMNIYFDINFAEPTEGTILNIVSAQLRLYKLESQVNLSAEGDESLSELKKAIKQNGFSDNVASASLMAALSEEYQIHVSIYYYTRSLKKRRVKRTLIASSMLPRYQEGWTEWNVQRAVNVWKKEPTKNYGLVIVVQDDENNPINANKVFSMINCSRQIDMAGESSKVTNANSDHSQTPALLIKTIEVPNSEGTRALLYRYTWLALDQRILKNQKNINHPAAAEQFGELPEQHRIRHSDHWRKNLSLYNSTES